MYGYAWWRSAPPEDQAEPFDGKPPDLLNPMVRYADVVLIGPARRVSSEHLRLDT